jgi:hypothetical protein
MESHKRNILLSVMRETKEYPESKKNQPYGERNPRGKHKNLRRFPNLESGGDKKHFNFLIKSSATVMGNQL